MFSPLWPNLPGPGRQPQGPFLWLKFVLESRLPSKSLEPLNDFLAYLKPQLWLKKQKLVKIVARKYLPDVYSTPCNNSPADWARELFKPSKDGESLVVRNENRYYPKSVLFTPCFQFCLHHQFCLQNQQNQFFLHHVFETNVIYLHVPGEIGIAIVWCLISCCLQGHRWVCWKRKPPPVA